MWLLAIRVNWLLFVVNQLVRMPLYESVQQRACTAESGPLGRGNLPAPSNVIDDMLQLGALYAAVAGCGACFLFPSSQLVHFQVGGGHTAGLVRPGMPS